MSDREVVLIVWTTVVLAYCLVQIMRIKWRLDALEARQQEDGDAD